MKITKLALTLVLLTFGLNLQAQEGVTEGKPQPTYKAPNGKAFPANWGAPPLRQTRDLRVLPGGYGRGSGTLARWIQENLDKDAKKNRPAVKPGNNQPHPPPIAIGLPAPTPRPIKPGIAKKAYPKHWGAPPRLQTKDLRPLPGGYGLGSSTLASWIQKNLANDAKNGVPAPPVAVDPVAPRPVDPPVFDPNAKARALAEKQAKVDTAKVKEGIKAWEVAKAKCKGNYSYKVGFESWVGFGHETTIVVSNNKVTERHYRTFNRRRPVAPPRPGGVAPPQPEGKSWTETGKAIGTNKQGAPAKTLDELYVVGLETAKKRLRQFERRYIRSDKQGLLVSCYIMDRRIADDAPRNGLIVSSIQLGGGGDDAAAKPETGGGDCSLCRTEAHQLHLGQAENGGTITVKLGSVVRVKLRGNPTTGFTWNNSTPAGVLKLMGKVAHQAGGRPGLLGAPGMSTATFATTKLGKDTIVLNYNRVFEKNKAPASTVKINIVVTKDGRVQPPAAPGKNTARIAELEKEIAKLEDFARRARFTPAGLKAHQAKLAKLEQELAALKAGGKVEDVPTFEEWVKDGKKIPAGRVFLGGSPWFNERTGQRRQPQEVYAMIFGKPATAKPAPKPAGRFPAHWGAPPRIQTRDLRLLPGGYGRGSSTLARWIQQNLDKDKANPNRDRNPRNPPKGGVLKNKLTLKDAQGGFAGFTGWVTTINEDGTWNRRQFFNQQLRPIEKQGKLTDAQVKDIKAALATAQVEKLPARLGNFRGANPHVVTLTYGDRQSVLTLPTGAKLAKPLPGGKLDGTLAFALVAHELMSLKQGAAAGGLTKITSRIYRAANGKAFPAHWGAPPRIQTRDFRPLPGGYGNGSGTLGRWIQQNLDKDKAGANTTKPVAPPNAANGKEIAQLQARVKQIKNFMARARLTKEASDRFLAEIGRLENRIAELNGKPQEVRPPVRPPAKPKPNARKKFPAHWGAPPRIQTADYRKLPGGYGSGSSTMAGWIQRNLDADAKDPNRGKPEADQRPAVSAEFAKKRPAGSYAPGELLVGMQKGTALADSRKALQQAIPGFVLVKAMANGTVLHVRLPSTMNVEQGMAKLMTVKSVSYAELNGIVRIQPLPRPGIRPGPRIPPRKLGKPLIRPRR